MNDHLTNIVVVAIIYNDENQIFVARRAATKTVFPNRMELVGGHVDPDEKLEDALYREVKEEISCDITVGPIMHAFTERVGDSFDVELAYLCELAPGQEPVLNPEDHSEFLWIGSNELDKFEKEDEETEALRKAFAILEGEA